MQWTVSRRITAGFALALILVVGGAVAGVIALNRTSVSYQRVLAEQRAVLVPALQAESDFRYGRFLDLHFLLKPDESYIRRADSVYAVSRGYLVQLRDSARTSELRGVWSEALAGFDRMTTASAASLAEARAGHLAAAIQTRDTRVSPLADSVRTVLGRGVDLADDRSEAAAAAARTEVDRMRWALLLSALLVRLLFVCHLAVSNDDGDITPVHDKTTRPCCGGS